MRLLSVTVLATLAATSVHAAGMTPGMWEITSTSQMQIPGMPKGMGAQPPSTFRHCYTAADVKDHSKTVPMDKTCKLISVQPLPNGSSWKISCQTEAGPMTGSGQVIYTPTSYTGTTTMNGKMDGMAFHMTQRYTAKRIGPCK